MGSPQGKPRVTIETVAEQAGVSPATVSRILSQRPGWLEQLDPDTVRKVRAVAEKLGCQRNHFAGGMPSGSLPFFALILHQTNGSLEGWHHWAFERTLLEGMNAAAGQRAVYPVVVTMRADGDDVDTAQARRLVDGGVFGAIVCTPGASLESLLRSRLNHRQPIIVLFPRQLSAWPTNAIGVDNRAMGRIAARLLASRSRERWALIGYEQMTEAQQLRAEGFLQAAGEAGAWPVTIRLPLGADEHDAARRIVQYLQREAADGMFAVDSSASIGAVLACLRAKLSPGSDCDLVGYDASLWHAPGLPRITSVDVSWREVGTLAVKKLVRASRSSRPGFKTILVRPRIVEGDSCPVPTRFRAARHESSAGAKASACVSAMAVGGTTMSVRPRRKRPTVLTAT